MYIFRADKFKQIRIVFHLVIIISFFLFGLVSIPVNCVVIVLHYEHYFANDFKSEKDYPYCAN